MGSNHMKSILYSLANWLSVLVVLVFLVGTVWAQGGSGEVSGLVTDPSGAVTPRVQVTLINSATGEKRTTTTNQGGAYRFTAVSIVGSYTLEAAAKGFSTVRIQNLVVSVGTTTTQDLHLEVGQASE